MMMKLYNPEESVLGQDSTLLMIVASLSKAQDGTYCLAMVKIDLVLAWADSMKSLLELLSDLGSIKIEIN
jgi:hypothetical protein